MQSHNILESNCSGVFSARGLLSKSFVIFVWREQKFFFIRRLICINTRWPPYDLPIIILCFITLEKIKIGTWIRFIIVRIALATLCNYIYNDDKGLICINPRWRPCDLTIIALCIVPLEQMKIGTCIMCQNNQDWNFRTEYSIICIN